jgi:hypothetical protein
MIKKRYNIYFFLILTLFFGFIFEENSSGGGKIDYEYLILLIESFANNFEIGFQKFVNDPGTIIHSPAFYIIFGFFLNFFNNIEIIKILYLLVSSILPYIFYLILKTKYQSNNNYIFYFSLIIFISPYFRSSGIWLLGDNLSLLFFSLSILFYLKSEAKKKEILNFYLCFVFLILSCYIRYYYCVFSLFFLYYIYRNLNIRHFVTIIVLSTILSLPAFFYLYLIIINYNFYDTFYSFGNVNFYSTSLVIFSIMLFYLFPFLINKNFMIIEYYKKRMINLLLIPLFFMTIYLLNKFFYLDLINFSPKGGGVFIKFFKLFNLEIQLFMSFIASFFVLIIDYLFKDNRLQNYILLLILLMCFPLSIFYQKYLDPLIYLFIFGLVKSSYIEKIISHKTMNLYFVFIYFFSFYLFSLFYYFPTI